MDFFKNISLNLHATGPAAVMIVWILRMTLLGLFGNSSNLGTVALGLLGGTGALIIRALGHRHRST